MPMNEIHFNCTIIQQCKQMHIYIFLFVDHKVYTLIYSVMHLLCVIFIFTTRQLSIFRCYFIKHSISQPISNYIKQCNVLSIYLMGALWLVLLSVFVTFSSDVRHNNDGICTIVSLVFCVIVDYPASEISNHIYQVTSNRHCCKIMSVRFKICISTQKLLEGFTFIQLHNWNIVESSVIHT
jgi:hypothetical protein